MYNVYVVFAKLFVTKTELCCEFSSVLFVLDLFVNIDQTFSGSIRAWQKGKVVFTFMGSILKLRVVELNVYP